MRILRIGRPGHPRRRKRLAALRPQPRYFSEKRLLALARLIELLVPIVLIDRLIVDQPKGAAATPPARVSGSPRTREL